MRASEFREMTSETLRTRLQETRRELFNLRQQWYAGSLQDHNRMREVRKDIARIQTVLREQELAADEEKEGATV